MRRRIRTSACAPPFFSFKVEKKVEKLKKQLAEVKKYSMIRLV